MPCDSSYMEPTHLEKDCSQALALLEELKTGQPVRPDSYEWRGEHREVYNKSPSEKLRDNLVAQLCRKIRGLEPGKLRTCSLELQMWMRDHDKADIARVEKEKVIGAHSRLVEKAMAKLTPLEQRALGLRK